MIELTEKEQQAQKALEHHILEKKKRGHRLSRNINIVHKERLNLGDRLADNLADWAGSWTFISLFMIVLAIWMVLNSIALLRVFDPFPFILLNLVLSCIAAIQAPVIMMSQNRQEAKDRLRAEHDYEVNLKAEIEIEQLHEKLDTLREKQWQELCEMQQRQIEMLDSKNKVLSRNARLFTT
ncbi:MAG: DUF1003 domain-containing protein [Chloroflexi bacterium]|nr:DUF1003 domain-containing protein [Chloroflexota bacterium]